MSKYTPNYQIPQYESEDKPNLRDQYNSAMDVIDGQMKKESDDIIIATAAAQNAQKTADEAKSDVETLQPIVEEHTTKIAGLREDVNTNTDEIGEMKPQVAKNTEDIATNTANIAKNTADIANNREDADMALSGLATKVETNETDIASIENTIGTYGTAAQKDFTNTITSTGAEASKLPTSSAVAQEIAKMDDWVKQYEGAASLSGETVKVTGYINNKLKMICLYTTAVTGTITAPTNTLSYSSSLFTMQQTHHPTHNLEFTNRCYLNLGFSTGLDVSSDGSVKLYFSTSQAVNGVGFGESVNFYEYSASA